MIIIGTYLIDVLGKWAIITKFIMRLSKILIVEFSHLEMLLIT